MEREARSKKKMKGCEFIGGKPDCGVKVRAVLHEDQSMERGLSTSIFARIRNMVNEAHEGHSLGKLRLKLAATWIAHGRSGERLTEPSTSWSFRSFQSGRPSRWLLGLLIINQLAK